MVSYTGNVFMSLIYAVLLFVNATLLLLTLGFEFLALINILVYVGALAVLFLFVIMLLEVPTAELRSYYRGYSVLALIGFSAFSVRFFGIFSKLTGISSNYYITSLTHTNESISNIGYAFYVNYADLLILNSLVLTIALLGALVLAHTSKPQ
ncbi:NADH-quinone oxidoreductase subunit J family protein [Rhizobium oryzihabitans]|uniref:NADH-quinone oxidoreductase subunit J family protein n=1 Tax=Rhizobium oryzihabitans TaxID=2267833 RepID=UPI0040350D86